jgi:hypothetical protein
MSLLEYVSRRHGEVAGRSSMYPPVSNALLEYANDLYRIQMPAVSPEAFHVSPGAFRSSFSLAGAEDFILKEVCESSPPTCLFIIHLPRLLKAGKLNVPDRLPTRAR